MESLVKSEPGSFTSLGISVVELVIVMSFFAIITSLVTINVFTARGKSDLADAANVLIADVRSQQLKAMAGAIQSGGTIQSHGVYFERTRYVLFRGLTYTQTDTSNFSVPLEENVEVSTASFPSSEVVFAKGSGEIVNYLSGSDTIQLRNTINGEEKTIKLNRYGVVVQ